MSDDNERQGATSPDDRRQVATTDDSGYTLSVEEALALYEAAGVPRTIRSIQRFCAKGHLDAHRIETPFGEKFLITPASVERHIAYIKEVQPVATSRDVSRHAATSGDIEGSKTSAEITPVSTSSDNERQATTISDMSQSVAPQSQPVSQPVAATGARVIELLEHENAFLRDQVAVKDKQIDALNERVRETNILTGGLHKLLTPLIGKPDRIRDDGDYPIS